MSMLVYVGEGESSACLRIRIWALYIRIYDQESSEFSNFNLRYESSQNCETGLKSMTRDSGSIIISICIRFISVRVHQLIERNTDKK